VQEDSQAQAQVNASSGRNQMSDAVDAHGVLGLATGSLLSCHTLLLCVTVFSFA
jgi:hypothetical protein